MNGSGVRRPRERAPASSSRPAQVFAERDRLAEAGVLSVYFVDDDFIGNQRAVLETGCALPARRR